MITECDFIEAWNALLASSDVVITSVETKDKYILDKSKLKFFSKTLDSWRNVNFISTEELMGRWIISKKENKDEKIKRICTV